MEVKINREIRDYTESMFFGLSMRQFFFSIAALGMAILLYFILKPLVGLETTSWACILGAVPFAAMGFVKYHGMTAEQFIWAWLKDQLIEPRELTVKQSNLYMSVLEDMEKESKQKTRKCKEDKPDGDEDTEKFAEDRQGTIQHPAQRAGSDPDKENLE